MSRITPNNIQSLEENQIFVFGSNEAGIHGAGAAKLAHEKFGAQNGYDGSIGLWGSSYAIPTKNERLITLPLDTIEFYVNNFIRFAKKNPYLIFLTTEIGCGLAGYKPEQIAPMFKDAVDIDNIHLPESFWKTLNK